MRSVSLVIMIIAEGGITWGQIWAPVVSTVLAATIAGISTVMAARNARKDAKAEATSAKKAAVVARHNAVRAEGSAVTAQEVADLLSGKNEVIDQWRRTAEDLKLANEALEKRVDQLHEANERLEARCNKIQEQLDQAREELDEKIEALRNASLLEREMYQKTTPETPS